MNRDLPQFGLEFEKMERFNPEAATGAALQKRLFLKKLKNSQKKSLYCILFYQKESPHRCFSVNFYKFLIATSLAKHLWVTASVNFYP